MQADEIRDPLAQMLDKMSMSVMVWEQSGGRLLYHNQRVCADTGLSREQLQGSHYRQVFWPEFVPMYEQMMRDCQDGQEHLRIYYWTERLIWEQVTVRRITWQEQTPAILLTITHITELVSNDFAHMHTAHFDHLLGLPNGQKLEEDINELANVETVALIYFELERLKDMLDLYGWDVVDELLIQIRDWLLASESRRAQIYRVNDGFAILGRSVGLADAKDRANDVLQRFIEPWYVPSLGADYALYCQVKVGIVYGKYIKNEMRNLILRTVRKAKAQGGYVIYDEKADTAAKNALLLRQTLINCVQQDMLGFDICYQPIVAARTHRWVGAEVLCRWTTPAGQVIPPGKFIRLAEQLGLIGRLDNWVREQAMRDCCTWRMQEREFFLDANFSPTQDITDDFIDDLLESLNKTGYPAVMLNLEITESARIHYSEQLLEGITKLKQAGIMLSLDDFGTGYSSFEYLIKMPVTALKVDKLFLDQIEQDTYRQYLLKILVDIAHHLQMHLIVEGVETAGQLALLERYDVDYMQGYYFSRPLSRSQFAKVIGRYRLK